ncbi:hypothetical protein DPMN_100310, partial [Dreissena polymorpha]
MKYINTFRIYLTAHELSITHVRYRSNVSFVKQFLSNTIKSDSVNFVCKDKLWLKKLYCSYFKSSYSKCSLSKSILQKQFNSTGAAQFASTLKKRHFSSFSDDHEWTEEEDLVTADNVLNDETYKNFLRQYCNIADVGHRVFILHIAKKQKGSDDTEIVENRLAENVALVESIPGWAVVEKVIVRTNIKLNDWDFLEHKHFADVALRLRRCPGISALFLTVNELSAAQTVALQAKLQMPVFNRPFMMIQACKAYARSKEARVAVALAELPHTKFQFSIQNGRIVNNIPGEAWFHQREKKLQLILASLKRQREKLRLQRKRHKIPTVSVIGYTNSGKTSLIKALTGDQSLQPEDRLFATLDVTLHAGRLPNSMVVLYIDTMGFISDLPSRLQEAFSATLEDISSADAVVHVTDCSHPDCMQQKTDVTSQVSAILSPSQLNSIIHVYNKVDVIH